MTGTSPNSISAHRMNTLDLIFWLFSDTGPDIYLTYTNAHNADDRAIGLLLADKFRCLPLIGI
jgi:hypothetical protein